VPRSGRALGHADADRIADAKDIRDGPGLPPRRYRSAAAGGDQDIGATLHHSGYRRVGAGGYPFNTENNVLGLDYPTRRKRAEKPRLATGRIDWKRSKRHKAQPDPPFGGLRHRPMPDRRCHSTRGSFNGIAPSEVQISHFYRELCDLRSVGDKVPRC